MRATLAALTDELRRLKAAGVKTVAVSPEGLAGLKALIQRRAADAPALQSSAPGPSAPPVPVPQVTVRTDAAEAVKAAPSKRAPERKLPEPPAVRLPDGDKASRWQWLRERVLQDPICGGEGRSREKVVFGVGSLDARLFFCGDVPGAEEESQSEPFVGPAGQLLTKMIQAMGLTRDEVYISNVMNWRPVLATPDGAEPAGNRPPTAEELAYCLPYLRAQIEIVQPEVIIALGATAAKGLLGPDSFKALGDVRGQWQTFADRPLIVTYHPSYILRNPSNRSKRMIWEDLLKAMERASLPVSARQRGFFLGRG